MGIVKKPTIATYWAEEATLNTPIFPGVMTRNRYQLLLRFIHFNDNDQAPAADSDNADRLYKIRPVIDHLFEKFQTNYCVNCYISIHESLLLWKGILIFKQYLPLTRSRFGIKIYKFVCESQIGYVYKFYVYVGKDESFEIPPCATPPPPKVGVTENIVWFLILPL